MKKLLPLLFCWISGSALAQDARPTTLYLIGDTAYAYDHTVQAGARSRAELYNRGRRFMAAELDASDNALEGDSTTFDSLRSVGYLRLPDVAGLSNLIVEFTATLRPADGTVRFEARDFILHGFAAGAESYDFILEKLRDLTPVQRAAVYRAFDARWNELVSRLDRLGR